MNKKLKTIFIILFTFLILTSCNEEGKQYGDQQNIDSDEEIDKEEKLSENIKELFSKEDHDLYVKQGDGEYYPANDKFTQRILEELKEYSEDVGDNDFSRVFNIILNFKGFKEIYLNTEKGYYWFGDSQDMYSISTWDKTFWERYILKEINGQITYYGFEKDILGRNYTNRYGDGGSKEVVLYYDGDIRLNFMNKDIRVLSNVPEDSIESLVPSNQMKNQLYIEEDAQNNRYVFLVGSKYSFTNRYGSTAWLSAYEYSDNELKETWNIKNLYRSKIIVKDYDKSTLTLEIEDEDLEFSINLTQDEIDRINEYISFLEEADEKFIGKDEYLFFSTMSEYEFIDYNNDGNEELVTTVHMRGGAPGITEVIYFTYSFTIEGIELKEILPAREYEKLIGR